MTSYGPPRGPGVQPPFAAPPTEGGRTRVWLGVSVAAGLVALCCIGGIAGFAGLVVAGTEALNEQARATVGNYLDALDANEYEEAYDLLCDDVQRRETLQQFTRRVADDPQVETYTLHDPETAGTTSVVVRADLEYTTGGPESLEFLLVQDRSSGQFEVCGIR